VQIDMNPREGVDPKLAYKDAVFLSPHKFIGGPGTPGVLVAKRALFTNRVPVVPGGGTVRYVNTTEHSYLEDPELREEGGTPAIIESIRAGLVFQLKEAVGVEAIRTREEDFIRRAVASWQQNPNLEVLGNHDSYRLSIVSFVVRHSLSGPLGPAGRYLHHNFVATLLNDLFGIQARAGCSCAGPYGHRLLGIDLARSREFEREIVRGSEGIKPGWVRVNFNYFLSEQVFQFLLEAVHLVAREGHKLLPEYDFDPHTGTWTHRKFERTETLRLGDLSYRSGKLEYRARHATEPEWALPSYLDEARRILAAEPCASSGTRPTLSQDFEHLRWFPLPGMPSSPERTSASAPTFSTSTISAVPLGATRVASSVRVSPRTRRFPSGERRRPVLESSRPVRLKYQGISRSPVNARSTMSVSVKPASRNDASVWAMVQISGSPLPSSMSRLTLRCSGELGS
jgi:hypothetical protein